MESVLARYRRYCRGRMVAIWARTSLTLLKAIVNDRVRAPRHFQGIPERGACGKTPFVSDTLSAVQKEARGWA